MKYIIALAVIIMLLASCTNQKIDEQKYISQLDEVTKLWQTARTLHPAWQQLYPVCLINCERFTLYKPEADNSWRKIDSGNVNMQLPDGIMAAFPMPFHNYEMACVLDDRSFSTKEDMTIVFHEFVHCYQAATCDSDLKERLFIAKEYAHTNGMWELQYPFPYENDAVGNLYIQMIEACEQGNREKVAQMRNEIRTLVSANDWEYLTWQEFKEGSARWLQNTLAREIGANEASSKRSQPIDRVTFYEGGEKVIQLLTAENPALGSDFPALWKAITEL